MRKDKVVRLENQEESEFDHLTELLREGASRLIAEAVEAELEEYLSTFVQLRNEKGQRLIVRNGYLPEREVLTGIGPVKVKVPKIRDRSRSGIKFNSNFLPPYLRRTQSVEEVLPVLYLKGLSTGDFGEALEALLGKSAKGLSSTTISRLKAVWEEEYLAWNRRDLSKKKYVYLWADGVYFNIRLEDARQCVLVIIGVTETGKKELIAIEDGYRESEQSWKELLRRLKEQGLKAPPKLAVGDGALGFWKALPKVYEETRKQRCWVHKTANVLNKLPKSVQAKAKGDLHEVWMAPTRQVAHKAFDRFIAIYSGKYPKAVECLSKDRDELLAFYDFPAEHWVHIRTTNPIESTFATIRLRTKKSRGCVSRKTALSMVFKLGQSAEKRWRKLRGFRLLGDVIRNVKFCDGVREELITKDRLEASSDKIAA